MIVSQKVLDALKQIGLNLYERKLWVALLSRGTSTAGELSSLAKVPHSRTYDVLESLAEKGFVLIQFTKPIKYVAIPPYEALERAKKKIKEDSEVAMERITDLQKSSVVKELDKIFKQGVELIEPGELTGTLKGDNSLRRQLDYVLKNAKNSITIVTTENGLKHIHSTHRRLLEKISNKGVKIKIAAPVNSKTAPIVNDFKRIAEVKKLPENKVKGRMIIVDNEHVIFGLTDDKKVHPSQDMSLWTKSEHVASNMLLPMFENLWKQLPKA